MKESGTSVVRPGFIAGAFHRLSNHILHGGTWTVRTVEPGSGGLGSAEFGWGRRWGGGGGGEFTTSHLFWQLNQGGRFKGLSGGASVPCGAIF